jgi:hypothetical protein
VPVILAEFAFSVLHLRMGGRRRDVPLCMGRAEPLACYSTLGARARISSSLLLRSKRPSPPSPNTERRPGRVCDQTFSRCRVGSQTHHRCGQTRRATQAGRLAQISPRFKNDHIDLRAKDARSFAFECKADIPCCNA